ncbi:tetratricopeptide repeat protein [Leptolyngbya sp. PCC 6406]|uniref:tetratricopeptide repeat protein n=1 Tax=Leptolyngbya sp. PCC 6406 TaxID=1173264 RepID=UPI0004858CF5|nr:tetratricopeptide repeat protein [Leptolyngbya sp. PCC 6406]
MVILHIDLHQGPDESTAVLRYGWENLNQFQRRTLPLGAIADLVAASEATYYTAYNQLTLGDLVSAGQQLYRWLDGADRWLTQTLATAPPQGNRAIGLAIATAGALAHVPWELLHDGEDFLATKVRPVVPLRWCGGSAPMPRPLTLTDRPQNRALTALFMATAPTAPGVSELSYEQEEAQILQATARQQIALQVEESGCLTELRYLLASYPPEGFPDVIHFSGHAGHGARGPIFLTETETGDLWEATAADIGEALQFRWPSLLFLSGCRTGERMAQGAVPSLAEALIAQGAGAVLGWGRPVLDRDAMWAAAALYGGLAEGLGLLEAQSRTVRALLKAKARDWHLLRLYVGATVPGALVTPLRTRGRKRAPQPTVTTEFLDGAGNVKVASRESFVGRRRPLQHCLRVLRDPSDPRLGVLIWGLGGHGKSSLAARLGDRLPEFQRLVWVGRVDEPTLVSQLANALDQPALRPTLLADDEDLKYRLRRVFRQLLDLPQPPPPFLLVLDDFEQNLEADCRTLKPAAAAVLTALVTAITEAHAPHRLILTCRYEFDFALSSKLALQPLGQMQGAELTKKCAQLPGFMTQTQEDPAAPQRRQRALALADGNPRLLEWLDKLLQATLEPGLDLDQILARLEALEQDQGELRQQVLAATLLDQMDAPLGQMLRRGLLFLLPVPLAVLGQVCTDMPGFEGLVARALRLGLLETTPPHPDPTDPTLLVRVPRVLPLTAPPEPALAAAAAQALYGIWWQGQRGTEAQQLEVHRLALAGQVGEVAAEIADVVARGWNSRSRFREVVHLCKNTLRLVEDYRVYQRLAWAEDDLGDREKCLQHYQQALDLCPEEDEEIKASILHNTAVVKANQGDVAGAIALYQQSLEIKERIGDAQGKAATLHQMAILKANQGDVEGAIALYQQSLEIQERIGNAQGKAASLHQMAILKANQGDVEGAIALYQQSLEIEERIGNAQGKAISLATLGNLLVKQKGDFTTAIPYLEESLAILQRIGSPSAATVQRMIDNARALMPPP